MVLCGFCVGHVTVLSTGGVAVAIASAAAPVTARPTRPTPATVILMRACAPSGSRVRDLRDCIRCSQRANSTCVVVGIEEFCCFAVTVLHEFVVDGKADQVVTCVQERV